MHDALRELPPPAGLGLPYPQLVIPYSKNVYGIRLLPADLSRDVLIALAWSAMDACELRHRMCLVFHRCDGVYLETDGSCHVAPYGPLGGVATLVAPPELDFLPGPDPMPAPVAGAGPRRALPPFQLSLLPEDEPSLFRWPSLKWGWLAALILWYTVMLLT